MMNDMTLMMYDHDVIGINRRSSYVILLITTTVTKLIVVVVVHVVLLITTTVTLFIVMRILEAKSCSNISQNLLYCSLGYVYKHIGTPNFLVKVLWVYSHLKSDFFWMKKLLNVT